MRKSELLLSLAARVLVCGAVLGTAVVPTALADKSYVVKCAAGDKVADVLAKIANDSEPAVITVVGVCSEFVSIGRDNVTLQGAAPGDGLQAPSPTRSTLGVSAARRVGLIQLTLRGGSNALGVWHGAYLWASDLRVTGAATKFGIIVQQNSDVALSNPIVENSFIGIAATDGGYVSVSGGSIRNNANTGVFASTGGLVRLRDGVVVHDSGMFGILASQSAYVDVDGATVERNATGVQVSGGGCMRVTGTTSLIQNNQRGVVVLAATLEVVGGRVSNNGIGIEVADGSSVAIRSGAVIENNQGDGVRVQGASALRVGEAAIIRGNTGNGMALGDTCVASFFNGDTQIINNAKWGIACSPAPSVAQIRGQLGTVSGNGQGQNNCPMSP